MKHLALIALSFVLAQTAFAFGEEGDPLFKHHIERKGRQILTVKLDGAYNVMGLFLQNYSTDIRQENLSAELIETSNRIAILVARLKSASIVLEKLPLDAAAESTESSNELAERLASRFVDLLAESKNVGELKDVYFVTKTGNSSVIRFYRDELLKFESALSHKLVEAKRGGIVAGVHGAYLNMAARNTFWREVAEQMVNFSDSIFPKSESSRIKLLGQKILIATSAPDLFSREHCGITVRILTE